MGTNREPDAQPGEPGEHDTELPGPLAVGERSLYARRVGRVPDLQRGAVGGGDCGERGAYPDQLLSPASPQLNLVVSGANMTLTRPVANAGYTLQSRTNLVSGDWTAVTHPPRRLLAATGRWCCRFWIPGNILSAGEMNVTFTGDCEIAA